MNKTKKDLIIIFIDIIIFIICLWFFDYSRQNGMYNLTFQGKIFLTNWIPFYKFGEFLVSASWVAKTCAFIIFGFLLADIFSRINFFAVKINYKLYIFSCSVLIIFTTLLGIFTAYLGIVIDVNNILFFGIGFFIGVWIHDKGIRFIKTKRISIKFIDNN